MTGKEIQNHNRKFCRFGPYQPLARHLRFKHTRAAVKHKQLKFDHTVKELNIHTLGARFLPKMVNIANEKKAGWYHQSKNTATNFNYYNSIISEGYMTSSTNCLESLNRR